MATHVAISNCPQNILLKRVTIPLIAKETHKIGLPPHASAGERTFPCFISTVRYVQIRSDIYCTPRMPNLLLPRLRPFNFSRPQQRVVTTVVPTMFSSAVKVVVTDVGHQHARTARSITRGRHLEAPPQKPGRRDSGSNRWLSPQAAGDPPLAHLVSAVLLCRQRCWISRKEKAPRISTSKHDKSNSMVLFVQDNKRLMNIEFVNTPPPPDVLDTDAQRNHSPLHRHVVVAPHENLRTARNTPSSSSRTSLPTASAKS